MQEPDSLSVTSKSKVITEKYYKLLALYLLFRKEKKKKEENASFDVFLFSLKPDGQGFEMPSSFQQ